MFWLQVVRGIEQSAKIERLNVDIFMQVICCGFRKRRGQKQKSKGKVIQAVLCYKLRFFVACAVPPPHPKIFNVRKSKQR